MRWQGLEVVEVVERIGLEAFVGHIGLTQTVVGTTTDSSTAAASIVYTRGSPRTYPVVDAGVVVVGRIVVAACIVEHIEANNFDLGCSFDRRYLTLVDC